MNMAIKQLALMTLIVLLFTSALSVLGEGAEWYDIPDTPGGYDEG